jgi:enolase-phosphatase E1
LYADVPEALERWHSAGLELSTYSSGSINAQKLLYRHSSYEDLSILFRSWFDTNIGSKVSSQSYTKIAEALKSSPEQIVFISDRKSELIAAAEAGVKVLFSQRVDNPETDNGNFIAVNNYADLDLKLI